MPTKLILQAIQTLPSPSRPSSAGANYWWRLNTGSASSIPNHGTAVLGSLDAYGDTNSPNEAFPGGEPWMSPCLLLYDKANALVQPGQADALGSGNTCTLSLWFTAYQSIPTPTESGSSANCFMFNRFNNDPQFDLSYRVGAGPLSAPLQLSFTVYLTGGTLAWINDGAPISFPVDSSPHYLVATFDGTTLRIYVDGTDKTSQGTQSGTGTGNFIGSPAYIVGRYGIGSVSTYPQNDALIAPAYYADAVVSSGVLSSAQILANWKMGMGIS